MSTNGKYFALLTGATAGLLAASCGAAGASEAQMAQGQSESATGARLYEEYCTSCHGESGAGDTAPAVLGSSLLGGRFENAQDLFNFVADKMPKDAPASLDMGQYWHVVTFMVATTGIELEDRLSESNAEKVELAD